MKSNNIDINQKRKKETKLLEELKKLNEDIAKEESEFQKDVRDILI